MNNDELMDPLPSVPPQGRVARLHFRCQAELPIGSNLHVSASLLLEDSAVSTETNSVPLYTTPETYPLWTTRRPVVVILHKAKGIQHHYYRYFVTTPGAALEQTDDGAASTTLSTNGSVILSASGSGVLDAADDNTSVTSGGSTPHEFMGNAAGDMPTFEWENPSFGDAAVHTDVANLPYRTLDIQVDTGKVVRQPQEEEDAEEMKDEGEPKEGDNAQGALEGETGPVDSWNNKEDVTFQPYLILEAVSWNEWMDAGMNECMNA